MVAVAESGSTSHGLLQPLINEATLVKVFQLDSESKFRVMGALYGSLSPLGRVSRLFRELIVEGFRVESFSLLSSLRVNLSYPLSDLQGRSLATFAIVRQDLNRLEKLYSLGVPLNEKDRHGDAPSWLAVKNGYTDGFMKLYHWGFAKGAFDGAQGESLYLGALIIDAVKNQRISLLLALNNLDVDFNVRTYAYCGVDRCKTVVSPAMLAVMFECLDVLELLHGFGVNFTLPTPGGASLVTLAVYHSRIRSLKKLRELGMNLEQSDYNGMTPATVAATYGYIDVLLYLNEQEVDLTLADRNGETPMHIAQRLQRGDVVETLYHLGVRVNENSECHCNCERRSHCIVS